ncbi:hypothetical protein CMI37_35690 [Candidatus Pacearchaeota archaeon]|nr:hypothetical protein [Candidatus Pacearchaeota archaeon]
MNARRSPQPSVHNVTAQQSTASILTNLDARIEVTKMDRKLLIQAMQDPEVVAGCLAILYAAQTPGERDNRVTVVQNGAGFNAFDAGFGSSLAEQAIAGRLSAKQVGAARSLLRKYVRQISRVVSEPPRIPLQVFTPGAPPVARPIESDLMEIAL